LSRRRSLLDDAARRELERLRAELAVARADAETARADAETARGEAVAARAALAEQSRSMSEETDELERTNLRLRRLDGEKTRFLATMSHDLRTPLNSIIGFTDLILSDMAGPVSEEQRRYLTLVFKASTQLLALINDILDVSRVESGNMPVLVDRFSLSQLIGDCVDSARALASRKDLVVRFEPGGCERLQITSDRTLLRRVLDNLLGNAVKFTERGQVRVDCRAEGSRVRISVRDTGIGIPPQDLPKLFEPFRQIRRSEGSGLGLHLCKRLLTVLQGDIGVESRKGEGSTFSFSIPLEI
jgi:signal transduction histidine kinase